LARFLHILGNMASPENQKLCARGSSRVELSCEEVSEEEEDYEDEYETQVTPNMTVAVSIGGVRPRVSGNSCSPEHGSGRTANKGIRGHIGVAGD